MALRWCQFAAEALVGRGAVARETVLDYGERGTSHAPRHASPPNYYSTSTIALSPEPCIAPEIGVIRAEFWGAPGVVQFRVAP